jgi:hypothetical protein
MIKRALTRRRGKVEIPPSQRLVLGIQFAIIALVCLTALEIAYMVVVRAFSSEIFAAITLVVGTILGSIFGQKA